MRDIEFRGKTKGGEWYIGFYDYKPLTNRHLIYFYKGKKSDTAIGCQVIPETVGQYTGLKDKNGVKIFEGDILKIFHFIDGRRKKHFLYHVVQWSEKYTGWIAANNGQKDADPKNGSPQLWCYVKNEFEIAGNIHDNPELLHAN